MVTSSTPSSESHVINVAPEMAIGNEEEIRTGVRRNMRLLAICFIAACTFIAAHVLVNNNRLTESRVVFLGGGLSCAFIYAILWNRTHP